MIIVMMIHNEDLVLERCIRSWPPSRRVLVIDHGSSDDSVSIVHRLVPNASVRQEAWEGFSVGRNRLLDWAACEAESDEETVLMIDADQTVEAWDPNPLPQCVTVAADKWSWTLPRMTRAGMLERYVGRTHECLSVEMQVGGTVIREHCDGSSRGVKLQRDLSLLMADLVDGVSTGRTLFYMGNTHRDLGQVDKAISAYKAALEVLGDVPHVSETLLQLARLMWTSGRGDEAREYMVRCVMWNPDMREGLEFMSKIHDSPWKGMWLNLSRVCEDTITLFRRRGLR